MFLEIMREMSEPRHFPRAVSTANGLMMLTYIATVVIGYSARGEQACSPVVCVVCGVRYVWRVACGVCDVWCAACSVCGVWRVACGV